jgi:hypothetical protein
VVPESPTAQDSPVEEQQPEDPGTEDKTDEGQLPLSDTEPEKLYRDVDEVESFRASGVQGHRRDLLRIQDPLPTQGTSLQDFAQRCCCRCCLAGHHLMDP